MLYTLPCATVSCGYFLTLYSSDYIKVLIQAGPKKRSVRGPIQRLSPQKNYTEKQSDQIITVTLPANPGLFQSHQLLLAGSQLSGWVTGCFPEEVLILLKFIRKLLTHLSTLISSQKEVGNYIIAEMQCPRLGTVSCLINHVFKPEGRVEATDSNIVTSVVFVIEQAPCFLLTARNSLSFHIVLPGRGFTSPPSQESNFLSVAVTKAMTKMPLKRARNLLGLHFQVTVHL